LQASAGEKNETKYKISVEPQWLQVSSVVTSWLRPTGLPIRRRMKIQDHPSCFFTPVPPRLEELDLATPDRESLVMLSNNNVELFTYENFHPGGKRKGDRSGTWP